MLTREQDPSDQWRPPEWIGCGHTWGHNHPTMFGVHVCTELAGHARPCRCFCGREHWTPEGGDHAVSQ